MLPRLPKPELRSSLHRRDGHAVPAGSFAFVQGLVGLAVQVRGALRALPDRGDADAHGDRDSGTLVPAVNVLDCVLAIAAVLATLTWRQSREYVSAEVLYAATIGKNPDAWMAHLNLGWLRLQRGELEAAVRDTKTALRLEPNLPQGHNNLSSALRSLGRFDAAERAYREALRRKPDDIDTRYNLGLVLIDLGRPGEAIGYIQAYLLQHPEDAPPSANLETPTRQ